MQDLEWLTLFENYYCKNICKVDKDKMKSSFSPLYIGFKVTEYCNQNCIHCWADKKTIARTYNDIIQAIDKIALCKPYLFGITGGEPFIREDCLDIIKYCVDVFPVVEILTNAVLLDDEKIKQLSSTLRENDVIQISLDGMQSNYFKQRGKDDFTKVINNIKKLINYSINIRIHMTVTSTNIDDMIEVYELANQLGCKTFSVTYVYPLRKGNKVFKANDLQIYNHQIEKIQNTHREKNRTMELSIFVPIELTSMDAKVVANTSGIVANPNILHWTIDAAGDIYNYMDHYIFKDLKIGNIYTDSLDIIHSNNLQIQKRIMTRDLSNTKCYNCSLLGSCIGGDYISNYPQINKPDKRCLFNG